MIGDLVRLKPLNVLKKIGIKTDNMTPLSCPYIDDVGVVVQITQEKNKFNTEYVVVHWQRMNEEISHFSTVLDIVSNVEAETL